MNIAAPPRFADIEICCHCNARCVFCPVSANPLPPRVMPDELFEHIITDLHCFALEWVALNHYNEPLLDPGFWRKVEILARNAMRLRLYTNGILLTPDKAKKLARLGIVESIVVNVPSADAGDYRRLMGVAMPPALIDNIGAAQRYGYKVYVCVNGTPDNADRRVGELQQALLQRTGGRGKVYRHFTHDRAGLVNHTETIAGSHWQGTLGGCARMREHIHVDVEGKVFLCCQDYLQQHVWGDLGVETAASVWHGATANLYRSMVSGDTPAPDDFICRRCAEVVRTGDE